MCWSLAVVITLNSRQSSAKSLVDEFWTTCGRSLMYARKRRGPRTVPWGTPDVMSAGEECTPSRSTSCFLSAKNDPIHLSVLSWTPWKSKFVEKSGMWYLIKGFTKVQKNDVNLFPLWKTAGNLMGGDDKLRFGSHAGCRGGFCCCRSVAWRYYTQCVPALCMLWTWGTQGIIAGLVFRPVLADGYYPSVSPIGRHLASVQRALEQSRQDRCNLFSCTFEESWPLLFT